MSKIQWVKSEGGTDLDSNNMPTEKEKHSKRDQGMHGGYVYIRGSISNHWGRYARCQKAIEHYFPLYTQVYSDRWKMYALGTGKKQLILEEAKMLKPNKTICEEADILLATCALSKSTL